MEHVQNVLLCPQVINPEDFTEQLEGSGTRAAQCLDMKSKNVLS